MSVYRPGRQARAAHPAAGHRMYAIGIVRKGERGDADAGMVDGPHPELAHMLDTVPLDRWSDGGPAEIAIFRLTGEASERLFSWSAAHGGWEKAGALLPSEEAVLSGGREQQQGDAAAADARAIAETWRRVLPHLGSSQKLTALAQRTVASLEEMAARIEAAASDPAREAKPGSRLP